MPRGQNRKIRQASNSNPLASKIFSSLLDNLYQTKKVIIDEDSLKKITSNVSYTNNENPEFIKHYISQIQGIYDIPHKYETVVKILTPTEKASDKERKLPPKSENTTTRVVGVFSSHEVFNFPQKMKLLGDKGVLVPKGSALKITPDQSQLLYNDRNTYDKEKYGSKGIKFPESRYIVIVDFVSDNSEDHAFEQKKELEKLGSSELIPKISKLVQ